MSFRKRNSHTKSKRADSTKIHVVVRVRPRIAEDLDSTIHKRPGASAYEECVEEDEARSSVFLKKPYFDTREFAFDCVLGRGATQAQAYEAVARGVVDDVMAGFNGTILAYGQTGSGKSHSVMGSADDLGIIPRLSVELFERIEQAPPGVSFVVSATYLELYNEVICDLLNPGSQGLKIRQHIASGIYVEGLTEVEVATPAEIFELVAAGNGFWILVYRV